MYPGAYISILGWWPGAARETESRRRKSGNQWKARTSLSSIILVPFLNLVSEPARHVEMRKALPLHELRNDLGRAITPARSNTMRCSFYSPTAPTPDRTSCCRSASQYREIGRASCRERV